ncbi:hypothetical protein ACJ41O_008764 [Fusarium nematophilum]
MFCYRKYSRAELEDVEWDRWMGLTPVEEKLIALNLYYGFITKYSIPEGHRQNVRYPRHVKGHITVFPNNVQELAIRVLPYPILKVMDDIYVSWQGPEKLAPSDLSALLSVRRRVVEKALVWLKRHNPLYADIDIDTAELDSWDAPSHGGFDVGIRGDEAGKPVDAHCEAGDENVDSATAAAGPVHEISSSGMFALDGRPDIADVEKLRYVYDALRHDDARDEMRAGTWVGSAEVRHGDTREPYILVSRGEDFADPFDVPFFVKTFPTLFPVGRGGPRQAEEGLADVAGEVDGSVEAEARTRSLVSSRNMTLETWAKVLLRSLSLYGFRQPMSRESRLSMRRKIKSFIIREGIPAIWFTLNPNDIINPVKLRLAVYRTRDPDEAEAFLTSLDLAYKRARLAVSDPLSSAVFFYREISMFFEHYVKTGEDSVFGRISRYFGAVETNERGALHVYGLLWIQGNMRLSSILGDVAGDD